MQIKTALLVVDVQVGLIDGLPAYKGLEVVGRIKGLIDKVRRAEIPVVYVQHDGRKGHRLEPNTAGWPIHPNIAPTNGDIVVHKRACDSFFDTDLQSKLEKYDINHLVVVGCMTEYCIDTTCRRAVSLGYDVTLIKDAHTTCDNELLTAAQIIAHHNSLLDGLNAGEHEIILKSANEMDFLNLG